MLRKILTTVLVSTILLSLVACGSSNTTTTASDSPSSSKVATTQEVEALTTPPIPEMPAEVTTSQDNEKNISKMSDKEKALQAVKEFYNFLFYPDLNAIQKLTLPFPGFGFRFMDMDSNTTSRFYFDDKFDLQLLDAVKDCKRGFPKETIYSYEFFSIYKKLI